jgi:uncharacterized OsmC-like protein
MMIGGSMSDEYITTSVRSSSSGTPGRSLNAIRQHHLVIDGPQLGVEITSSEAFLAGISSCGVNLVERAAREEGIAIRHMAVAIEGQRHRDTPNTFARITLRFTLSGPTQAEAEALVRRYTDG